MAVFFAITEIIISSIKLKANRPFAHVFVEMSEGQPPVANSNSPSAVIFPVGVVGIGTSLNHGCPGCVLRRPTEAMRSGPVSNVFLTKATAAFRASAIKFVGLHDRIIAAFAFTIPQRLAPWSFACQAYHGQFMKFQASKINESRPMTIRPLDTTAAFRVAAPEAICVDDGLFSALTSTKPSGFSSVASTVVLLHSKAIEYLSGKIGEAMASSCYNFFRHIKLLFSLTVLGDGRLSPAVPVFIPS